MTVELNPYEFERNWDRFMTKNSITALRRGLGKAWEQLMNDVAQEIPTAPILTSALRGSMSVFVNKALHTISKHGIPTFLSRKNNEPAWTKGEEAILVINAPYATIQHEKFPTKSESSAGRFYLLKKLRMNTRKYGRIVVDEVKRARV